MRLTGFTDYGLRALMRMAGEPGRVFSTAALAAEFGLSRHHLTKIVQRLAEAGIVATRRGGGGGAVLLRDPAEVSLGEVVRLLEDRQPLVGCFPGGPGCTLVGCCRLRARLRDAEAAFMAELDRATLADIALAPGLAAA